VVIDRRLGFGLSYPGATSAVAVHAYIPVDVSSSLPAGVASVSMTSEAGAYLAKFESEEERPSMACDTAAPTPTLILLA